MNFFEMVKKWTISDYRTQGINNAVIIDMLISEFVAEIMAYGLNIEPHDKHKIKLLAKEFPIKLGEKYVKNAKASYLLSDEIHKKIYLTELNTTAGNFPNKDDREQLLPLISAESEGVMRLWNFFFKVLDRHIKRPSEESRKYFYTLHKLIEVVGLLPSMKMSELERDIKAAFADYQLTIMYITMPAIDVEKVFENRNLYKFMEVIHLKELLDDGAAFDENYISDEKRPCWQSTREILEELMTYIKK